MLKAIADSGNGLYFFILDKDAIADAFTNCLGGLLSVVGQNIYLDFKALGETKIIRINTKFQVTEVVPNLQYKVKLPDLQSEEERDILCEVTLAASDVTQQIPVVQLEMSYFNVLTLKQDTNSAICTITRGLVDSTNPSIAVDKQKNRMIAADAITGAKAGADANQYENARTIIKTAISTITNSASSSDSYSKSLLDDLQKVLIGLQDTSTYVAYGSHQMSGYQHTHYQQRSNMASPNYVTPFRSQMQQQMQMNLNSNQQ